MNDYPELKVRLIAYTPDPEWVVAVAARLCYSSLDGEELLHSMTGDRVGPMLKTVIEKGHFSVLEHAVFSFLIEGVSRVTTHQLVRHRIGCSYSQRSQRYVREKEPRFIVPPEIRADEEKQEEFVKFCRQGYEAYKEQVASGVRCESARYLLPQAVESKIFVSMSARALYHFFQLRTCERAQGEIRTLAKRMLKEVQQAAPRLFQKAGPPCVGEGSCPEGEFSCGRIKKLQQKEDAEKE